MAVVLGSVVGGFVRKGLNQRYIEMLYVALGLCAVTLGIRTSAFAFGESEYPVLFIFSLSLGAVAGTWLKIDERFNRAIGRMSKGELSKGLSMGLVFYCIGALSILGPIMSALRDDNTFLYTNAALDVATSCILASSYGFGMLLAVPVLFLWQTALYLMALWGGTEVSEALMAEVSIVGGVLITASGVTVLKVKDCHTLSLLPALLVPPIFFLLKGLFT